MKPPSSNTLSRRDYRQEYLEKLHEIHYLSYDDPIEPQELHDQYKNIQVWLWGEEVVGFWLLQVDSGIARIKYFAVHPRWRRRYIGTVMMDDLVNGEYISIVCRVDEYNLNAQLFLRDTGFRCDYFHDSTMWFTYL